MSSSQQKGFLFVCGGLRRMVAAASWIKRSLPWGCLGHRFSQTSSQSASLSSSSSTCHWSCTVSTSGGPSSEQQSPSENKAECVLPGAASNSGLIGEGRSVPVPLNADKDIQRAFVNLLSLFTPQNGNDDDLQPRTNKRHYDPSDAVWNSSWRDSQGKGP
jgi:hypothetical protein